MKKVAVIGLDCAAPQLVFDVFFNDLPNIRKLSLTGTYGRMRSTDPPITCPAWMSMMTGKNPGTLGLYGFRNRQGYGYRNLSLVNSNSVQEETLWDILGKHGKKSIVIGVPPTYPPKPIEGYLITCFLTPDTEKEFTYPAGLKDEIKQVADKYIIDVSNFRSAEKKDLLNQIYLMTENRFKVARYLLESKEWEFFMMVEMGPDRIHHGFWSYCDPGHARYVKGNKFENAIKDYYKYLDDEIGRLLPLFDKETLVMVVSDHGAKKMAGGIAINQWLMEKGYLHIKSVQDKITAIGNVSIDWSKTRAWGEGGYYSRIFLNVKGREPQGVIEPGEYGDVRSALKEKLESMTDEAGKNIGTKVFYPEDLYGKCNKIPPDLIVYIGDLNLRSIGSIGHPGIYVYDNDTGSDDANHDYYGIFMMNGKGNRGWVNGTGILDVAPTVLDYLGIKVPRDMTGEVIY